MASISVLHIPGTEQVASAKTAPTTSSEIPESKAQGNAQAPLSVASPTYHSPRIEIDPQLDRVIIQYVNSASGLTNYQVPTKSQLALYAQTQAGQVPTAQAQTGQAQIGQAGTQQQAGQTPAPQAPAPQPPVPQAPISQPAPTGQSAAAPPSVPTTGSGKGVT